MKFSLYSDLHLEFSTLVLPSAPENILLLSGDILLATVIDTVRTDKHSRKLRERFDAFFAEECSKYKQAFYIAGNHEHYSGNYQQTADLLRKATEGTNVKYLENESVDLGDGIWLYGATLWTNFNNNDPVAMQYARQNMNDYRVTGWLGDTPDPRHMRPQDTYDIHVESLKSLEVFLNDHDKVVVMTHHAPSFRSKHPRYLPDDPLNHAYYSALDLFVMDHPQIKAWTHGHTHDSHDYMIGETRVLCNPRGYSYTGNKDQENYHFDINGKEFEVI